MKRILFLVFTFCIATLQSQTIVKMALPQQAKEQISVVVLFEEQVPEGIPVVLGLMGYNVIGGLSPYTFEWLQNGKVIGTSDIVVITPAKGDNITLKATDKNRCYSVTSFNMKVIAKVEKAENGKEGTPGVFPTMINNDEISVFLPKTDHNTPTNVRVFDLKGIMLFQTIISESTSLKCQLSDGNYFVSIKTTTCHKIEKIIVKH